MSDLISRSELYDELGNKLTWLMAYGDDVYLDVGSDIKDVIDNMPTAYDVDKVVEDLEEAKGNVPVNRLLDDIIKEKPKELGQLIAYDKAIEIVKQGGISDDACEWRLCDEEANVYDTSCRNPHILIEGTPKENNYEYCPYCGKKIKVVE